MSSMWGHNIKISLFGESHGKAIGVIMDNLPSGETIDFDKIMQFMARRAPGNDVTSTKRKEADIPNILSGIFDGKTTGTPLCAIIENTDTHSSDYTKIQYLARPSHADLTGFFRYNGFNDIRGGGHFSARLTAPLVFAGAVSSQILERKGVTIGTHLFSVKEVCDTEFDSINISKQQLIDLKLRNFPTISTIAEDKMREQIEIARLDGDSVGGVVECCILDFPIGIGNPIFDNIESKISSIVFSIPAVKGIEFGEGFHSTMLYGSENNDSFYMENGAIKTKTNHHGGILGGISSGMPIVFKVAFKPTPSIAKPQNTVDYVALTDESFTITGRHDPCVAVRAVACIEAAAAIAMLDFLC